ncbi:uncharacterized protein LOC131894475 isoform X8 [Peromyscus eremicus]|uniref:uncharacterized protein LOC131894475 isoform X8 n=1 Tax=Peromyscus eremicus TaxID=42410 RepID=UPI0027DDAE4B|nr:uncharacterized protein LOC131894475 isoform X8 [Peromyscus eremicus]
MSSTMVLKTKVGGSKGTSAKEPEQRNKKLVRVNTEVQHSTDPKPFCNEERHPGELQSILKKPVQISTVNAGTEQKTPISKGTSAKEPEQRNKKLVRVNTEVQHSTDPKPFCNEERHPGELQSILKKPVQISTVNAGTEQKTPISKGTSAKEPEQRNKKLVRVNTEVQHSTDPKPFCNEERHPGELQSILKKPVQISTVNAGTEQKTPISKGTSAKEPEQRNKKLVRVNTEVQHSTDPKPFCNEERHPGELQSILKKPVQISTVNAGTEQKTPISKGTSAKEPEQRNKKLVRVNTEVQHSTDPKPFCNEERHPGELQSILKKPVQISTVNAGTEQKTSISEAMPLKQMKSVNRTKSAEFREEVDNNIEQKPLSRLSHKPDPDVPGTTIEDNDSTSVVKKITQDQEKTKCDSEYKTVGLQPPSEDAIEEKWVRIVATQYSYLNQYLRERFKEKMKEGFESDTSDDELLPSTSGGRTHSMQKMTEEKKKRDGQDARVHSRLPLVRRKEDVKEQADWHHTQLNELLRNDIKELIKEELATGHAKMRELLRKDLEEIRGILKKELRQLFVEEMALLQEQEHWNLQYLKELFRRELKEMVRKQVKNSKIIICPKEEPLPGASKGTADYQRTSLEQRKKKKHGSDHDSAPSHSEKPSVQTEEEVIGGQSDSRRMPLKELIKEDLKEALCEILEKYKCDTCMKKELPHIRNGRKQLRKISTKQELRKKYDSESLYSEQPATKTVKEMEHEHSELQHVHLKELIKKDLKVKICDVLGKYKNVCPEKEGLPRVSKGKTRLKKITEDQEKEKCNVEYASLWSWPSVKTDEVTIDQQNSLQYKHLKKYIRENVKEMVHEQLENAELIIHPKEEPVPDDSRREISTKVKEKKSGYLHIPVFESFEHRIAALRATAHVEPAPAACPRDAGDLGDMDKAFKAQLARAVALADSTEHQRWQPHTDPELAPGHRTGDARDPPHNADLALDKLSIDLESAPLCGPSDTKDPANDADLAFHTAHPTGRFRPSMSTNNRSDLYMGDIPDSTRVVWRSYQEASSKKNDGQVGAAVD